MFGWDSVSWLKAGVCVVWGLPPRSLWIFCLEKGNVRTWRKHGANLQLVFSYHFWQQKTSCKNPHSSAVFEVLRSATSQAIAEMGDGEVRLKSLASSASTLRLMSPVWPRYELERILNEVRSQFLVYVKNCLLEPVFSLRSFNLGLSYSKCLGKFFFKKAIVFGHFDERLHLGKQAAGSWKYGALEIFIQQIIFL